MGLGLKTNLVRAATRKDFPAVLQLVNSIFPIRAKIPFKMEEKFPLLFCEDNLENIRVICHNGRMVSVAGYYPSTLSIEGCEVRVASVGSVCTDPEYQNQGLASKILNDLEAEVKQKGIGLLLISGTRSLYRRRNCALVGGFMKCEISKTSIPLTSLPSDIEIIDYEPEFLNQAVHLYNHEPARFIRTIIEFKALLQAALIADYDCTYRMYVIKRETRIAAYFLLRIYHQHKAWRGEVVEYAGDRNLVARGLSLMLTRQALDRIQVHAPIDDPVIWYLRDLQAIIQNEKQQGTVKIVDYPSLIKDLTLYFSQYTPLEFLSSLCLDEKDGHISFALQGERLIIESADFIPQLIFGFPNNKQLPKYLREQVEHQQVLKEFIKSVFPIPLPWTANMNYV
jgi:ribosomal protein S18 acetylase RimI-like enzyme